MSRGRTGKTANKDKDRTGLDWTGLDPDAAQFCPLPFCVSLLVALRLCAGKRGTAQIGGRQK